MPAELIQGLFFLTRTPHFQHNRAGTLLALALLCPGIGGRRTSTLALHGPRFADEADEMFFGGFCFEK